RAVRPAGGIVGKGPGRSLFPGWRRFKDHLNGAGCACRQSRWSRRTIIRLRELCSVNAAESNARDYQIAVAAVRQRHLLRRADRSLRLSAELQAGWNQSDHRGARKNRRKSAYRRERRRLGQQNRQSQPCDPAHLASAPCSRPSLKSAGFTTAPIPVAEMALLLLLRATRVGLARLHSVQAKPAATSRGSASGNVRIV